jgi:hypothetical protein
LINALSCLRSLFCFLGALAHACYPFPDLDVFPEEPEKSGKWEGNPLVGLPNCLFTPHIGGSTMEAQQSIAEEGTEAWRFSFLSGVGEGEEFSMLFF